jgi:hypothetical protein
MVHDRDAAVAPAPANRHLRLDGDPTADLVRDRLGLVWSRRDLTRGDRNTGAGRDGLGYVFEQLHRTSALLSG